VQFYPREISPATWNEGLGKEDTMNETSGLTLEIIRDFRMPE